MSMEASDARDGRHNTSSSSAAVEYALQTSYDPAPTRNPPRGTWLIIEAACPNATEFAILVTQRGRQFEPVRWFAEDDQLFHEGNCSGWVLSRGSQHGNAGA